MIKLKQDSILVKKRDGRCELFDEDKIQKQLKFAITPTDLKLEDI